MCFLNNTVGNVNRIFNVIVQFAPVFVDDTKPEHHQAVKLHHGVNFNCRVDGLPEPEIKWIFVSFFVRFIGFYYNDFAFLRMALK